MQKAGDFFLMLLLWFSSVQCRTVSIDHDVVFQPEIYPKETVTFLLQNIPSNTSFIVFQIHASDFNVTVCLTPDIRLDTCVYGRNVGVLSQINDTERPVQWYLRTNGTKLIAPEKVLGLAATYPHHAPIPGGCNMEFPLEMDPNLHLDYSHSSNLVSFQYGKQMFPAKTGLQNCDLRHQQDLRYTMYAYYFRSSYYDGLLKMLEVSGMLDHAYQAEHLNFSAKTQARFASFTGRGVIYNVVLRDKASGLSSAYVPVSSYNCENLNKIHCPVVSPGNTFGLVLVILLGVTGLFMCFFGHRYFRTEMFVFGFIGTALVAYILFLRFSGESQQVCLVLATLCGVGGGLLWFGFWYFKGMPIFSVLYVGLVAGYLVTSVVFNLTPLKDMTWWQDPLNYGLSFGCGVVIVPVLLLIFTHTLNLLCCAFVGGYLVVLAVGLFVGEAIQQIILLSINKSVWTPYLRSIVIIPYYWEDILLIIVWIVLAVTGLIFQYIRERNRAPFPPCPWQIRRQRRLDNEWNNHGSLSPSTRDSTNQSPQSDEDESSPLLSNERN